MPNELFVYGTLQLARVQQLVTGRTFPARAATLTGFARRTVRGETYPTLVPAPGERTAGLLLSEVDDAALRALDAYEGPLYERIRVVVALEGGEERAASAWLVRASERRRVGEAPWDLATFVARDLERFVREYEGLRRD